MFGIEICTEFLNLLALEYFSKEKPLEQKKGGEVNGSSNGFYPFVGRHHATYE